MLRPTTVLMVLAVLLSTPTAWARGRPPEGLKVGPWVISPYLATRYSVEDNIFRDADDEDPVSDQIAMFMGGVEAKLPIRNSMIELGYEATQFNYQEIKFPRDLTQDIWADVQFNFVTGDKLTVSPQLNRGFREVEDIDAGEELSFTGAPFDNRRIELEWDREVSERQGYTVSVTRVDQIFDEETTNDPFLLGSFFNYRGYDSSYEFRQPLPSGRWLTLRYGSRRFNHYRPLAAVGLPFRKEVSDTIYLGFRGYSGEDQPYFLLIGAERFRYELVEDDEPFEGVVGTAGWNVKLGTRTVLDMRLTRRPLPSNTQTYYIINEIRLNADRSWLKNSHVGLDLVHSRNRYGDTIVLENGQLDCDGSVREDQRSQLGAYASWRLDQWFGFRVSASHRRRDSNCQGSEYRANAVTAGLEVGW